MVIPQLFQGLLQSLGGRILCHSGAKNFLKATKPLIVINTFLHVLVTTRSRPLRVLCKINGLGTLPDAVGLHLVAFDIENALDCSHLLLIIMFDWPPFLRISNASWSRIRLMNPYRPQHTCSELCCPGGSSAVIFQEDTLLRRIKPHHRFARSGVAIGQLLTLTTVPNPTTDHQERP